MYNLSKIILWAGFLLILIIGGIHVFEAQDSFSDAVYKGWFFYANGLAAVIAAYGIYHNHIWAWSLALVIAIGSFCGYVASRTVGLPYIPAEPANWFEPWGITSLITEALFVIVFIIKRAKKL